MTLNPIKWWQERKQAQKHADALAGRTTSGHLSPGERDRLFRQSKRKSHGTREW